MHSCIHIHTHCNSYTPLPQSPDVEEQPSVALVLSAALVAVRVPRPSLWVGLGASPWGGALSSQQEVPLG